MSAIRGRMPDSCASFPGVVRTGRGGGCSRAGRGAGSLNAELRPNNSDSGGLRTYPCPPFQAFFTSSGGRVQPMLGKVFKAYDIRGTYPDPLNEQMAWQIGFGCSRFLLADAQAAGETSPMMRNILVG